MRLSVVDVISATKIHELKNITIMRGLVGRGRTTNYQITPSVLQHDDSIRLKAAVVWKLTGLGSTSDGSRC